ncbi:hypothetical protein [Bacillus toyonensis]|uniref:hypothetical protein n=1 Tax=Bacillus toyonensis TaxID=155322 RepID=UPI002E1F7325|nr:hypothetical protein [Bacillus toyonensis]
MSYISNVLKELFSDSFREIQLHIWSQKVVKEYLKCSQKGREVHTIVQQVHPLGIKKVLQLDDGDTWTERDVDIIESKAEFLFATAGERCSLKLYRIQTEYYAIVDAELGSFYINPEEIQKKDLVATLTALKNEKKLTLLGRLIMRCMLLAIQSR